MAAQVLTGTGNVSYTNTTGQNVRVVINLLKTSATSGTLTLPGGVTVDIARYVFLGKTLAFSDNMGAGGGTGAMGVQPGGYGDRFAVPMEFALANGDTFSISSSASNGIAGYNVIIIPEAG